MTRPARKSERVTPTVYAQQSYDWTGELIRADDGSVSGHMVDTFGWRLVLQARVKTPTRMDLTMVFGHVGALVPPWEDAGVRCDMEDRPHTVWLGHLTKDAPGDCWTGYVENSDSWVIHLTGTPDGPGKLALAGVVRRVPARHLLGETDKKRAEGAR